ncbi:RHS repeat-associated core domain-containing protein [Candidatus Accumulibacter vicinus]|uniref:Cell wall-associated polypeptide CWBP200 n=1 Tax=Candidatus Accumulibacter vicinus TaxID=2954382 RepID=A0A084Y4W3_9PROT|nr:RHS repeat-associated core domain-containing protein [Candidatus Accumulibacter vicinus]KFB69757.1 MAG: Cell wall-associated polypeptide CWBP200 [Candidatus Accumulibacter vicinus]
MTHLRWLRIVLLGWLLGLAVSLPSHAYHFPWDQGHDTTNWNNPTPPGPCQGPTCTPCNSTGSPVYIPTGHFLWSDTDIVLKGRPSLGIVRTYNSHDPRDGMFGNGWTIGVDGGLYLATDGMSSKYVLRAADGKRYDYPKATDGTITAPAGRFDQVAPQTDGSVHLINLDGSGKVFRSDGKLAIDVDANGNRIIYTYDGSDRLKSLSDGNGRTLNFSYNSGGRVSHVTDHAGRTWQYDYDGAGNLTTVTDPLGGVRRYAYAAYTATGDGQTYQHLTQVTDPSGVIVTQVTYSGERVLSYTEGANSYRYVYDTGRRQVAKTDSVGSQWRYVYDDKGLIPEEFDPLGNRVGRTFDDNGREIQRVDQGGQTWRATYDTLGRTLTRTNPLAQTTRFEYAGNNPNPKKIISPTERITQIGYDSRLNPTTVTDPAGAITRMEWTARGDLTASSDPLGNRTTLTYNAIGLPMAQIDPLGRSTGFAYDAVGNLTQLTNPAGEVTRLNYDALDRATQVTDALGQVTRFAYDAAGRLLSLTDPAGRTTQYAYDAYGRLATRTEPDGRVQRSDYRSDNLRSQTALPDARIVSYGYDAAKRLTSENAGGEINSFGYDARGLLTSAGNAAASLARSFDAAGRLTQETMHGQAVAISRSAEGERTQLNALGSVTNYTLDVRGLVTRIAVGGEPFDIAYDAAGRRTRLGLPNGSVATYGYDAANQLTALIHGGAFAANYRQTFDLAGRITRLTGDGADWNYGYDALGRLVAANHGSDAFAYSYDAVGNILGTGRTYDAGNRLTQDTDFNYSYDANGNLISKQHRTTGARSVYTWNARNQLVRLERFPDATATVPNKVLSFTYDPLGRRASKTEDGVSERYVYDGSDLIGVLDSLHSVQRRFSFGTGIDEPLRMAGSTGARYFHANHLGSVMALSASTGVVSQYNYDPYGKTRLTGEAANPFRYTGREQDAEDLYYYRARYYNPMVNRFLSEDPIGLTGSVNLYQYANANPLSFSDPSGLVSAGEVLAQIGAVGPIDAYTAKQLADQSLAAAQKSGLPGQHNGQADAYRHCLWSCLMAQKIGAKQAREVGDIHEKHGENPPGETCMDLHNNAQGRNAASGKDCAASCRSLLSGGKLMNSPCQMP